MKFTSKLTISAKSFDEIDNLLDSLNNLQDTMKDDVKQMAAEDAAYIADTLSNKYESFLLDYGVFGFSSDKYEGAISSYSKYKHKTSDHKKGDIKSEPELIVNETDTGFTVTLSGGDVLYHEYGTGLVGKRSKKPRGFTIPSDWKYASGPTIIQRGKYINSSDAYTSLPNWYKNALKDGRIKSSDAVWKTPGGYITQGNVAGHFMFDTYEEVRNDLQVGSNLQLGNHNLQIYVKNKLLDKK